MGADDVAAVEAVELTKRFTVRTRAGRLRRTRRVVEAVAGVSFSIGPGEMVGYIGPNGAGKSTTVKMLTGILTPSSGRARVLGLDPSADRIELVRRIGVVFGQRTQLWWDLPLRDSFDLLGRIYRIEPARHRRNIDRYCDLLDLGPLLDQPVRQLSLGQRMRGDLAAALLHDPEILFLDEPTIGLDVVSKHAVREFLATLNAEAGTTVMLTTHDLEDIERLCRRLLIIDHGQVVHSGGVAEFRDRHGTERTVVVDLVEPSPPLVVPDTVVLRTDGVRQWLRFDRRRTTAAEVIAAVVAVRPVRDLTVEDPDIDDLVRRLYTGDGTVEPD